MNKPFQTLSAAKTFLSGLCGYSGIPLRFFEREIFEPLASFGAAHLSGIDLSGKEHRVFFEGGWSAPLLLNRGYELLGSLPVRFGEQNFLLLAGPVFLSRPRPEEESETLRFFSPLSGATLSRAAEATPLLQIGQFASFLALLSTTLCETSFSVSELLQKNEITDAENAIPRALSDSIFEQRENAYDHTSYAEELLLLDIIRAGDVDALHRVTETALTQNPFRLSDDPLRQAVYGFVSSLTLITRSAIGGGLNEELAFNLCEVYIRRADRCRTALEVTSLLYTAASDFTKRVQETRSQKGYSGHVTLCIDYIFRHLHTVITLDDLAAEMGLSPAYLSVLFKKETGLPLADFIQVQRIEEAKSLLRFSEYRISEIGAHLSFSSQSYFTSVFRKHTGMTPKKYREIYYRRSW